MSKCDSCKKEKCKTTHRDEPTKKKINKRLKTIEGQIRGIENMIEEDKYCSDVLTQLLAINKSIKSLSTEILKDHLSHCVVDDIKNNNIETIDEVMSLISKFN